MKLRKSIMLFAAGITCIIYSCNEDVLEKSNPNQFSSETFFKTELQLETAVNAVYAGLQANNLYGRELFFLHDMLSDENQGSGGLEAPRRAALEYNLDPGNKLVNDSFAGLYRVIHRANFVIANAGNVPEIEISDAKRNRLEGEARFLRAWAYFELVSLWGSVPLITEPGDIDTPIDGVPKGTEEAIYNVIFEDLGFAEANLPLKSEYSDADMGRVTQGSAQALRGKIRLFRGEYSLASDDFLLVINSMEYDLVPRYKDNFEEENENNIESIFEVQFGNYANQSAWSFGDDPGLSEITFRGQEYTPQTGWRNVFPTEDLLSQFEPGDPRYDYNFYVDGDTYNNGQDTMNLGEPGWRKYSNSYKRGSEDTRSGINFRVIRYADVLLMMAEAENEVNGPATAIGYVNQVRARADVNMPAIPAPATADEMFDIIERERRVELSCEQIRNRDIRRWRRHGKLDSEPIANYLPMHDLLPIPNQEIQNNQALSSADQNPGY